MVLWCACLFVLIRFPVTFLEKLFTGISNIECIRVFPYFLRPKWFHWFHALIIHLIQQIFGSEAKKRGLPNNIIMFS